MTKCTRQIGRDARTGRFISVRDARRRRATSVIETITVRSRGRQRRRSPRFLTEENQNGRRSRST